LANFLVAFKTADYAEQKKGKGRALCPMKDSELPFADGALAALVPQDAFDEYLHIRIKVAEKDIQDQMEKENSGKIEELKVKLASATGAGEQLELDKHRLKIIDDIFTLKCPRCKLAFLDYSGCSAVSCAGCKCGFCSFCLEDCGTDAHQHFYTNGSKCPNDGGPIFVEPAQWQARQRKRKGGLLCKYLASVPEALRKKLADLCAPDAKDLGVAMPEDLSGPALDPEAHGLVRLKLCVPRPLRERLAGQIEELSKKGVQVKMPHAKAKVCVRAIGTHVLARKAPKSDATKKNIAARLPDGHEVVIEEEWIECQCSKPTAVAGFVLARHVEGRPTPNAKVAIRDAGGRKVSVRREARQHEGKNAVGSLDDGTEVKVVQYWMKASWDDVGPASQGFIEARDVPEDDVVLQGLTEDCWSAATEVEKALGVEVRASLIVGASSGHGGKDKCKGKGGKGKIGRGKGRGRG